MLNGADGLDWETLDKCDLMYLVEKETLYQRRAVWAPSGVARWSNA